MGTFRAVPVPLATRSVLQQIRAPEGPHAILPRCSATLLGEDDLELDLAGGAVAEERYLEAFARAMGVEEVI